MTDNAELIAEARQRFPEGSLALDLADALETTEMERALAAAGVQHLIDALDTAKDLAEEAEREVDHMESGCADHQGRMKDERDAYAVTVEKVRAWAERNKETGYGTGTGASALEILDILATAPADALREVKAEAWDEGAGDMAEHIDNGAGWEIQNPYREEQS